MGHMLLTSPPGYRTSNATIPRALPRFHLPVLHMHDVETLVPLSGAAALLCISDSAATARGFTSRNRYRIDVNQEMLALGLGNVERD